MALDEAIRELEEVKKRGETYHKKTKLYEAVQLGIEALERIKNLRVSGKPDKYSILPSETES